MMDDMPQAKGSRIEIESSDQAGRRYVEWRGFVMEGGTAQKYVMRRDFPDHAFAHHRCNEPPRHPIRVL